MHKKLKINKVIKKGVVFILILAWIFSGFPQIGNFPPEVQQVKALTATYNSSGTWTVPSDVCEVTVEVWGAGGGGASDAGGGGGGGGGGAYSSSDINVSPSDQYSITVGSGGTAGNAGGDSYFATSTVLAKGGAGGSGITVGTGGAAGSGTGTVTRSGGSGGSPFDHSQLQRVSGGGGGGSATALADGGTGGNGGNTVGGTGGTGEGAGGDGGTNYGNGVAGSAPGGAGGGSGSGATGGAGADGRIVLTYTEVIGCAEAPTLSSPTGTATGNSTADGSVTTNQPNGTLYFVVTTSATSPTEAQVKAGNDHTGTPASDSGSQSVTATGTQNVSSTGLTADSTYYFHYMHENSSTLQSTVSTSASFTTYIAPTLSSPTGSATGNSTASGSVSTNQANGTLYFVVTTSATSPTKAQVKAGQDHNGSSASDSGSQAVSTTGEQNVSATGLTAGTTYYFHFMHENSDSVQSDVSTSASFTTFIAPVLSSPTGSATGTSTADGSVSTNQSNGTLYFVVTTSATSPTQAQVKAGNDHNGSLASDSGSQGVTVTGVQNVSATGLTSGVTYYFHFMHENTDNQQSTVSTSASFTTYIAPTLSSPTGTETGTSTADGSVSTNQANGTLYFVVTTSATSPTQAQVKAGNDHTGTPASDSGSQAVSSTGVQNVSATGLTPETTYYFHFMHENTDSQQSTVSTSASFVTDPTVFLSSVSTYSVTNITINSAQGQGEVTDDGGADILSRGFVVATGSVALSDPGNTDPEVQSIYSLKYYDTATGTGTFDVTLFGLDSDTDYRYRAFAENSEGFTYGGDVGFTTFIAPVLSSPTATTTGDTTADGSVSTDQANGTLYYVVTTSATSPSETQVKAGQDHTGSLASNSGSRGVSGAGVQNVSASGLSPDTTYYFHFMHENSDSVQSDVSTSNSFTTFVAPTLSSPTGSATGTSTASGSVSTNQANGTLYFVVTGTSTAPTQAQVKAGNDHNGDPASDSGSQAVSSTGVKNVSATGLTANTKYYFYFMHENTDSIQSPVSRSNYFYTYTESGLSVVFTYTPDVYINSADGQGEITNDGGSDILRRGFVVATGTSPLSDPGNTDPDVQTTYSLVYDDTATGTGTFDVSLFGLDPDTSYRYRAFSENSDGFSYGEDIGFTTDPSVPPTLSTFSPSSVLMETVQGRGSVTNDGGLTVTRRGFVVATGTSPLSDPGNTDPDSQVIYSMVFDESGTFGEGSFSLLISGLVADTGYRYRAFAQNAEGFSYGEDIGFTTRNSQIPSMGIGGGGGSQGTIRVDGTIRVEIGEF